MPPTPPPGLPTLPPRKDKTFPFYFEPPLLTSLLSPTPFISKKTPIAGYCLSSLWAAGWTQTNQMVTTYVFNDTLRCDCMHHTYNKPVGSRP